MHQLGLLDLTDDALRAVLAWLPPQQLCRTAVVSRKLARLCEEVRPQSSLHVRVLVSVMASPLIKRTAALLRIISGRRTHSIGAGPPLGGQAAFCRTASSICDRRSASLVTGMCIRSASPELDAITTSSHAGTGCSRSAFNLESDEIVPQVLHKLGGWPVGLWQRADAGSVPYGELLQVQPLTSGTAGFQGRIINPRGAVADGMFLIRVASQRGTEVSS